MDKVVQSVDKLELSSKVKDHLEYTYEELYDVLRKIT